MGSTKAVEYRASPLMLPSCCGASATSGGFHGADVGGTMKFAVGSAVQCTVDNLNAAYKRKWMASHPGEDPCTATLRGEVVS